MPAELIQSLRSILPELALTAGLLLVVLVDAWRPPARDTLCWLLAVLSLGTALGLAALLPAATGPVFSGMLVLDPTAVFFKVLLAGAGLVVALTLTFRNSKELAGPTTSPCSTWPWRWCRSPPT
jgi:NADH:ubiquinone oxidoreductase subunit 2 (subunit N)